MNTFPIAGPSETSEHLNILRETLGAGRRLRSIFFLFHLGETEAEPFGHRGHRGKCERGLLPVGFPPTFGVMNAGKSPSPAVSPLPGGAGLHFFPLPQLIVLLGSRSGLWAPPKSSRLLLTAAAAFPALPVPLPGQPINPAVMLFTCKRQFVKICLGAAVTISMGFIFHLFTVYAHV